ncbi:MAG: hypothetical protein Q9M25_07020 [Mariprofundaceae bacterium]|nr:hypothetical protein [Mariprofundaceae bacterium]
MAYSCCLQATKKGRLTCPECGQSCFSVSRQTMLHQVQFPNNQRLLAGDYAFCPNNDCRAGYFSISDMIPKVALRAFQSAQDTMLCHCFDISESIYRAALLKGTAKAMKAFVVRQTKDELCACESRNPSGRCCLAAFKQMGKNYDC